MLAILSKTPLLNVQRLIFTRTLIATPAIKYERDPPNFAQYVHSSFFLLSHLLTVFTRPCLITSSDERGTLAHRIVGWENAVLSNQEAMTTQATLVIIVGAVSIVLHSPTRAFQRRDQV